MYFHFLLILMNIIVGKFQVLMNTQTNKSCISWQDYEKEISTQLYIKAAKRVNVLL